jgi:uncharacterized protein (TIGR02996 family)
MGLERLASLYAAVYDRPDDDGPRAVLADALIEAGDSYGEFIAIQLAEAEGRGNLETLTRSRELLHASGGAWVRPEYVDEATFERGFPERGVIGFRSVEWVDTRNPAMATYRRLVFRGRVLPDLAGLVGLRELTLDSSDKPLTFPGRLTALTVTSWRSHLSVPPGVQRLTSDTLPPSLPDSVTWFGLLAPNYGGAVDVPTMPSSVTTVEVLFRDVGARLVLQRVDGFTTGRLCALGAELWNQASLAARFPRTLQSVAVPVGDHVLRRNLRKHRPEILVVDAPEG